MTYDELQQAFLVHRRANGSEATIKLLLAHGADTEHPTLDTVPGNRWPALHEAFTGAAPRQQEAKAHWPNIKAADELDVTGIYARWNGARPPKEGEA